MHKEKEYCMNLPSLLIAIFLLEGLKSASITITLFYSGFIDLTKHQNWSKCDFSYRIHDKHRLFRNTKDFEDSRAAILKALKIWESESKLIKFYELYDNEQQPDVDITFALGDHNCTEKFDGPGGIVAHSSYPPHGLLHFDAEEIWSVDGKGLDLSYVTLHEIGHVLGLKHSEELRSIMNPIYRNGSLRLSGHDIRRLRRLFAHCHRGLS